MAALNIGSKIFEILKQFNEKNVHSSNYLSSKKDKLYNCSLIVDSLSVPNAKNTGKYTQLLDLSISTFLALCDDPDPDVRTVAEESLNKIIKGIDKAFIRKIHLQLVHEIKKNGSARSLKAAIWRFGLLSHMIWPTKGKAYISNLIPCFVQIVSRNDEIVIETLSSSLPLILKSLGSFMTDKDVQVLLEAFLPRITSSNAMFRRCAVNMILAVCLNCRKKQYYLISVMEYVVNMLLNFTVNDIQVVHIIGCFWCLKTLLPHLQLSTSPIESNKITNNYLTIYECCLHYTKCYSNHNITNAALETLCQLLQVQSVDLIAKLLAPYEMDLLKSSDGHRETSIFNFNTTLDVEEIALLSLQSDSSDVLSKDEQSTSSQIDRHSDKDVDLKTDITDSNEVLNKNKDPEEVSISSNEVAYDEDDFNEMKDSSESLNTDMEMKINVNSGMEFELKTRDLDIGSSRDADIPLKFCCRHLVSSFLLSGQPKGLIPDENVRVSVKSLTLMSIGHIFKIDASIFFETLTKRMKETTQFIRDILLYADHSDPQIRGNVAILVAFLLKSVFLQYNNSFLNIEPKYFVDDNDKIRLLDLLIDILVKGLEDVSAITCRQTLIGLSICLNELLLSAHNRRAINILQCFNKIAANPYFLVKVKLAEVLGDLPYNVIQYVTKMCDFQKSSISCLMLLISDQDYRVRHAGSTAFIKIISKLHYRQQSKDLTYSIAMHCTSSVNTTFVDCENQDELLRESMSRMMTLNEFEKLYNSNINEELSRIICLLTEKFVIYESRYSLLGCCETLCRLSEFYQPIIYPKAWDCLTIIKADQSTTKSTNNITLLSSSLMSSILNLLYSSSVSLDLLVQKRLLILAGNLISGMFVHNYNHNEDQSSNTTQSFEFVQLWECVKNEELSQMYRQLLNHILKLLNIYVHVIDNVQVVLPEKNMEELSKTKLTFDIKSKKKSEKVTKPRETNGYFANNPHYLKLHEILKAAHANYNITLETEASEMYLSLLNSSLDVLSQLLNLASVPEASQIMEELLRYLQSIANLTIEKSILCVQLLFKTIFHANLMVQLKQKELGKNLQDIHGYIESIECENNADKRLYMRYLYNTTQQITNILTTANNKYKNTNESRRQDKNFVASVIRNMSQSREKNSMISCIKLFEPMVIKALTQYTIMQNNAAPLQCQVLKLLTQLIKLNINYCSLDSENVFINSVLKQFEFIGDGHVPQTEMLLPNILEFLVNLSHTRNHSKVIISVPNIIQLCDGLMASGQPPVSHIIPALVPVVEDVFISRSYKSIQAENTELEATREVIFTMLLKLLEYHQVIELLIICIRETELNDQEGRWKRWSELTIDEVLLALNSGSLRIEAKGAYMSVVKLFAVISEEAFQPDRFLKILLAKKSLVPESLLDRQRWVGSINVIMLMLLSKSNEKDILERLDEISGLQMDPLNAQKVVTTVVSQFHWFAEFVFNFVELTCTFILDLRRCSNYTVTIESSSSDVYQTSSAYLLEQLTLFLELCIYLYGCERCSKIAQVSENLVNDDSRMANLHSVVLKVGHIWPIIACKWVHVMSLLKCSRVSFWSRIFQSKVTDDAYREIEINVDVITKMSMVIFYDDYICNSCDNELSNWFFDNYTEDIVLLANELCVTKLGKISAYILRTPELLSRFRTTSPSFVKNLLLCFENAHTSQTSALVYHLTLKLHSIKYVALFRKAIQILSQRIESLLQMSPKSVQEQLSLDQFNKMIDSLQGIKRITKYGNLMELMNKLVAQVYDHRPLQLFSRQSKEPRTGNSATKDWFISMVRKQCLKSNDQHFNNLWETTQLLGKLDADDCSELFGSNDFNVKLLRNSLILGARLTVEEFQSAKSLLHSPLYDVAKNCLSQKIQLINRKMNLDHEKVLLNNTELNRLFSDVGSCKRIFELMPSVIVYIKILETLPDYNINYINQEYKDELIKFANLCTHLAQWIIQRKVTQPNYVIKPHKLELCLQCIECICKEPSISKDLNSSVHYVKICSLAIAITTVVDHFVDLRKSSCNSLQCNALEAAFENSETSLYAKACLQTSDLVVWLEENHQTGKPANLPAFLFKIIKSLIISLARQLLVNSFVLTPPQAWKAHYSVVGTGPTKCQFPIMSSESNLLSELEVLEQFVFRVTLIGWTSRLQFEEMWMALLSVINVYQHSEMQSIEELSVVNYVNVLLIRAITRLLLQMLLLPCPGDPNSSTPVYTARDPEPLSLIQNYDKLFRLQDLILWKYEDLHFFKGSYALKVEHVFCRGNVERRNNVYEYAYGQVSVPYLWSLCGLHESKSDAGILELVRRRNEMLKAESIDLESCIQFLLELYTSWNSPAGNVPLCLRNEIVKSLQSISELFLKRFQFQWMLDTCLNMVDSRFLEDSVFLQYIIFAVCKAAAILTPVDKETQEKVLLLLSTASKSNFLPVRIAVLHSALYLLQGSILLRCDDTTNSIVAIVSEHIKFLDNPDLSVDLSKNEEYESVIWALIFFILENFKNVKTSIVPINAVDYAIAMIEHPKISSSLHQTIVQGLERLVVVNNMDKSLFQRIIRVATDSLKQMNPILSMPAIQLLLSCMYVEAAQAGTLCISLVDEVELENEPEMLVRSIERSSVLFDKIKKAYHVEVEILCEVVSGIFNDFFFTSNILTKVIGEFLSSQQQHPKLMSSVVFKVCERTNNSSQLDLLQEWVLFSLPNFIQNLPIAMSTWFLSCFFVSLSKNPWLQNLFPHVQSRIGKYEYDDKSILSMAAMDFYEQLTSDSRKIEFVEIFHVAGQKLGSPFNDVAVCFQ